MRARSFALAVALLASLATATPARADVERVRVTVEALGDSAWARVTAVPADARGSYTGDSSSCAMLIPRPPSGPPASGPCDDNTVPNVQASYATVERSSVASFVDQDPLSHRCFSVGVYNFASPGGAAFTARATLIDTDGKTVETGPFRVEPASTVWMGSTPTWPYLSAGKSVLAARRGRKAPVAEACHDPSTDPPPPPRSDPPNHPPVARDDHYHLAAGSYIWTTALANDSDTDGDRFTARVTRIEFRHQEWSGMDRDGTFSYVAGTNARIAMKKVIVYHLVDARGMKSRSAKITIDIDKPGIRRPSPLDKHPTKAKSAANAHWYASAGTSWWCFWSGFDSECFGVMSPPQVGALNATTPWLALPSPTKVAKECAKYGAHWSRRGRMRTRQ